MLSLTQYNAASHARLFVGLAIAWYILAFVSGRRQAVRAGVFGIFGTVFLCYGLYAGWKAAAFREGLRLWRILVPVVPGTAAVLALILRAIRTKRRSGSTGGRDIPEDMEGYLFSEEDFQALEEKYNNTKIDR